jgi:hypothetical protein
MAKTLEAHDKLIRGGCPEFCVNGISSLLRHPVFKLARMFHKPIA